MGMSIRLIPCKVHPETGDTVIGRWVVARDWWNDGLQIAAHDLQSLVIVGDLAYTADNNPGSNSPSICICL